MPRLISKLFDPASWRRVVAREFRAMRMAQGRRRVRALYRRLGPVSRGTGKNIVIADGLWDNPNHFFRLRLFLSALPQIADTSLVGILRKPNDSTRVELELLGFSRFLCLDEAFAAHAARYREAARGYLKNVRTHADFLALSLPEALPPYVVYDTVLKLARHPQPPMDSPLWQEHLAQALCWLETYAQLLDEARPSHVVMSHPWKSEYGIVVWCAIQRGIPAFHLTGYCEGVRCRRFRDAADYFLPVEHLSRSTFDSLPQAAQRQLIEAGKTYLAERERGQSSDINARMAFRPDCRTQDRPEALKRLGLSGTRPIAAIYAHVWYDFPHTFAMKNFTDFKDWMDVTLKAIGANSEVDWLLKPHPTEEWYGGFSLAQMVGDLPPHVRLLSDDSDSLTVTALADVVVTCHGTVGLEAASHGCVVISADNSYYAAWDISHVATSRQHYEDLLRSAGRLTPPDRDAQERALALIDMVLAPARKELGMLKQLCDSSGPDLYAKIVRCYEHDASEISREIDNLAMWITSGSPSYTTHRKLRAL